MKTVCPAVDSVSSLLSHALNFLDFISTVYTNAAWFIPGCCPAKRSEGFASLISCYVKHNPILNKQILKVSQMRYLQRVGASFDAFWKIDSNIRKMTTDPLCDSYLQD